MTSTRSQQGTDKLNVCMWEGGGGGIRRNKLSRVLVCPPTGVPDQKLFLLLCLDTSDRMIHSSFPYKGPLQNNFHCKNIWVTSTMFWSSQLHACCVCDTLGTSKGCLLFESKLKYSNEDLLTESLIYLFGYTRVFLYESFILHLRVFSCAW